jgi:hypothetical protein
MSGNVFCTRCNAWFSWPHSCASTRERTELETVVVLAAHEAPAIEGDRARAMGRAMRRAAARRRENVS